jgi:branched-chain amino acid transport system substrate-binding protein
MPVFSFSIDPTSARALLMALALASFGTMAGCPHTGASPLEVTPALRTTDVDAEADLHAADRAALDGHTADARVGYRAFLLEHPADPLVPLAHLGLGRVALAEGDAEAALVELDLARGSSDAVVEERVRFHRGIALYFLHRDAEAIESLSPLRGTTTDPDDTRLLLETLATAASRTGDHVLALSALDELYVASTTDVDRQDAQQRARAVIDSEITEAELPRAYDELRHDRISWPLVAVASLRAAYDASDATRVRTVAEALRAEHVELTSDLAEIVSRAERIEHADPAVIGAILPLTGSAREIGQRALRGLVLASGAPLDGPPAPGSAQLVFRDDAGDPARAATAVDELVSQHRAIAIVGPLDGPSAEAAAVRAQALGVPLITLSARGDLASVGPMVFRLFPTLDGEARTLVDAAVRRGAHRFGIIRPTAGFGASMRASYERAVLAAGGELVSDVTYEASATAFGPIVSQLAAAHPDAVLIADSAQKVALVAPALAAGGLYPVVQGGSAPGSAHGIALLIPSVALDPRMIQTTGRYLQGASFAAPFYAPVAEGEGRSFVDSFHARFGSDPDTFAAYAYDAFRLARHAVESGETTRAGVASRLSSMHDAVTAGASGGFDATRGASHAGRILVLRGDALAP